MSGGDQFGIVIAGHGSRDPDAVREFEALVELIKLRAPQDVVTHGYLEFATPTIAEAVTANLAGGAKQVAIVPGVLLAARHTNLEEIAHSVILSSLEANGGNVSATARALGVSRNTIYRKIPNLK